MDVTLPLLTPLEDGKPLGGITWPWNYRVGWWWPFLIRPALTFLVLYISFCRSFIIVCSNSCSSFISYFHSSHVDCVKIFDTCLITNKASTPFFPEHLSSFFPLSLHNMQCILYIILCCTHLKSHTHIYIHAYNFVIFSDYTITRWAHFFLQKTLLTRNIIN